MFPTLESFLTLYLAPWGGFWTLQTPRTLCWASGQNSRDSLWRQDVWVSISGYFSCFSSGHRKLEMPANSRSANKWLRTRLCSCHIFPWLDSSPILWWSYSHHMWNDSPGYSHQPGLVDHCHSLNWSQIPTTLFLRCIFSLKQAVPALSEPATEPRDDIYRTPDSQDERMMGHPDWADGLLPFQSHPQSWHQCSAIPWRERGREEMLARRKGRRDRGWEENQE